MPKNQNWHYTFQEDDGPDLSARPKYNYVVNKTEADGDGFPVQSYHLWANRDDLSDLLCDCPAAYHHARKGPCKHVQWFRRWRAIILDREEQLSKPTNRSLRHLRNPIYYDSEADRFYPFPVHLFEEEDEE